MAIIKNKNQKDFEKKWDEREKWFQDRIGKKVFRPETSCKCTTCANVYENGLIIGDKMHASYLHDCEGSLNYTYFDTKEEVKEYEKIMPQPKTFRKRISGKK